MKPKFSVIIPCFNNYTYTRDCIQSVLKNTEDFEVVIIDNGSTDESGFYFSYLVSENKNIFVLTNPKNEGFAEAINKGIVFSKGDYIVVLNNDTVVGPGWCDNLLETLLYVRRNRKDQNFMFCGPMSNNAAGTQSLEIMDTDISNMDAIAVEFHKKNRLSYSFTNFLSGFCFLADKEIFEKIGKLDGSFIIGGFEDNDLFLRSTLKGYKCVIDNSTFIYHHGQRTLEGIKDYQKTFLIANNMHFIEKHFIPRELKLCVLLRVKNGSEYLSEYLYSINKYCRDVIIINNGSSDDTEEIIESRNDIIKYHTITDGLNESRDRQMLLDKAYELGYDWAMSLDVDEQMPDEFTKEIVQKLMHPVNPEILAYSMNVYTFFEGRNYFRQDYPWNELRGVRMFRIFPNQKIDTFVEFGLHCSHSPSFSAFNTRQIRIPILHYGYEKKKSREMKFNFYNTIDKDPYNPNVGPFGYKHLTTSEILLSEFIPDNKISLAILTNDNTEDLLRCLYYHYFLFDEINILHTGIDNKVRKLCELFGANYYQTRFTNDFSYLRNYLKSKISTKWILFLDTDEIIDIQDATFLTHMINRDIDGYLFIVWNFQQNSQMLFSDNVRLIKNTNKIYWTHPVHETVSESVKENHLEIMPAPIPIKHYGFLKDINTKKKKTFLYHNILNREIRKNPRDPAPIFHRAFYFFENNNNKLGFEHLEKVLNMDPKFFLASKELGIRYLEMAISNIEKCLNEMPKEHYYYSYLNNLYKYVSKAIDINFGV